MSMQNHLEGVGEVEGGGGGGKGQGRDDFWQKRGRVAGVSWEWHKRCQMAANHLEGLEEVGRGKAKTTLGQKWPEWPGIAKSGANGARRATTVTWTAGKIW